MIIDSMWGLIIGDALGEPMEGLTAQQIREKYGRIDGFIDPPRVTDDSMLSMLVTQSIIKNHGTVDRRRIAQEFLANRDGLRRLGPTTTGALQRLQDDPNYVPRSGSTNGASMRAPPVGWLRRSPEDIVRDAIESSLATHGASVALAGACAVACAVSAALEDRDPVEPAIWGARRGQEHGEPVGPRLAELIRGAVDLAETASLEDVAREYGAGLETWESVPLAVAAVSQADSYEDAVLSVVRLGGDTDTIAAIAGAITGPMGVPEHLKFEVPWDLESMAQELEDLRG